LVSSHRRSLESTLSTHTMASIAENFVNNNIVTILSGFLTTTGLSILLPSLVVALVNLLGFTSAGVVGGSLATLIQSALYAGSTGGIFSALQSFGATAVVAPPIALALGITLVLSGLGWSVIQSALYAGSTSGIFLVLQSFGAAAVVAPPVALTLEGTLVLSGVGWSVII